MLIVSHDRYFLDRVVEQGLRAARQPHHRVPRQLQAILAPARGALRAGTEGVRSRRSEYIEKQEEYIRRVHYGQLHKQAPVAAEGARPASSGSNGRRRSRRRTCTSARCARTGDIVLPRRGPVQALRPAAVQEPELRPAARQAAGHHGTQRQRQDDAAAHPAGRGGARRPGMVQRGHLVELGYLRPAPEAAARPDKPVIRAVWPDDDPDARRAEDARPARPLRAARRHQVYQQVEQLSGGERSRAALAKLAAQGVNVLVLDEPTNHLDLWACDVAGAGAEGVRGNGRSCVSHDRYFLNRVVDLLIVLDGDGTLEVIHGNYDTYELMHSRGVGSQEAGDRRQETGVRSQRTGRRAGSVSDRRPTGKEPLSQGGGSGGRYCPNREEDRRAGSLMHRPNCTGTRPASTIR